MMMMDDHPARMHKHTEVHSMGIRLGNQAILLYLLMHQWHGMGNDNDR